jgi:hypothetical protein
MTAVRTEPFVPLTAARAASEGPENLQVTVLSQAPAARPFRALESAGAPPPAAGSVRHQDPGCEPNMVLQREGDQVTGIHIECCCGQVIDLAFAYDTSNRP